MNAIFTNINQTSNLFYRHSSVKETPGFFLLRNEHCIPKSCQSYFLMSRMSIFPSRLFVAINGKTNYTSSQKTLT